MDGLHREGGDAVAADAGPAKLLGRGRCGSEAGGEDEHNAVAVVKLKTEKKNSD